MKKDLVEDNLGLVGFTINRYFSWLNRTANNTAGLLDEADLYNEGVIGLIEAAKKYKKNSKLKFSTFATNCIKYMIMY